MCGISGFLHFEADRQADARTVRRMSDAIFHRGPDGEGFHVKQNLALGHRRLAIIDLNTGHQPMYSDDKDIVLIFNGEIYNYIELREELKLLGNKFTTTSDTEVIIHAYRTWGVDCQNHFNGMWAFALWDEKAQRLFISRDRIGEKPLYYSRFDQTFIFGSEIKSVIAYGLPTNARMDLVEIYMTLGFVPSPYTLFENIYQLMPGKYLLVNVEDVKCEKYWDLPDISESDLSKDKNFIESEFEKLFEDSVTIRMRSDVDFGAFLSGGLDSSCVVSTMAKNTTKQVKTFTIGFKNKQYDERGLAKLVAKKLNTQHHEQVVTSELFDEAIEKVLYQYDEPFGDPSAIPTGHISKYAAEHVKMVLTGDGGDEVLSGYTMYLGEKFASQYQHVPKPIRNFLPGMVTALASPFRGNIRYKLNQVAKVLDASRQPFERRLLSKLARTSLSNLGDIILPRNDSITFEEYYRDVMKGCRFKDHFYQLMFFHHKVTLPDNMLTKVDRMSMAYSIETRIPFLDYRIIELLYGAHKNIKMKGYVTKLVLRNTIANRSLPKELLDAPKRGFNVPLTDWFKEDDLHKKIREILLDKTDLSLYNPKELSRILNENKSRKNDLGSFLWIMLVLKKWKTTLKQSLLKSLVS